PIPPAQWPVCLRKSSCAGFGYAQRLTPNMEPAWRSNWALTRAIAFARPFQIFRPLAADAHDRHRPCGPPDGHISCWHDPGLPACNAQAGGGSADDRRANRPEFAKLMAMLMPNDVVVVTRLDRLGRSTR